MTDFQLKRLQYFIKSANEYGWIRLAPSDKELFEKALDQPTIIVPQGTYIVSPFMGPIMSHE